MEWLAANHKAVRSFYIAIRSFSHLYPRRKPRVFFAPSRAPEYSFEKVWMNSFEPRSGGILFIPRLLAGGSGESDRKVP